MPLDGLPEGVEAVRFGKADAGQYFWDGTIRGPLDQGSLDVLIVQPAPGWDFTYDIATDTTAAVKAYGHLQSLLVKFEIANERDEKIIRAALAKLPGLRFVDGRPHALPKEGS